MLTVLGLFILGCPVLFGPAGVSYWACRTGLVYNGAPSEILEDVRGYPVRIRTLVFVIGSQDTFVTDGTDEYDDCLLLVIDQSVCGCLILHWQLLLFPFY